MSFNNASDIVELESLTIAKKKITKNEEGCKLL